MSPALKKPIRVLPTSTLLSTFSIFCSINVLLDVSNFFTVLMRLNFFYSDFLCVLRYNYQLVCNFPFSSYSDFVFFSQQFSFRWWCSCFKGEKAAQKCIWRSGKSNYFRFKTDPNGLLASLHLMDAARMNLITTCLSHMQCIYFKRCSYLLSS